ncbi:mechanosensitive ion channel family protein [Psychroflexus planctonicus]|uniref:Mechanosensitive ion channel protein MscS n=1 Tax=Psychroflexus planctonicus TaxID=1526575 RepID=A0ABQ1SEQ2_9FLAO|nr:mechanosensitive ion channel family protein [Psychroflexus planctonicus]GGE33350.1 mechanosensitive ion channel protein MscS [Psychroflexus planctonicus]
METKVLTRYFYRLFKEEFELQEQLAIYLNLLINVVVTLLLAYVIYKVLRVFSENVVHRLASKSKTQFDDFLVKNKTFLHLSNLLTVNFISFLIPFILVDFPSFEVYAEKLVGLLTVVFVITLLRSILLTFKDFLKTIESLKDKPVESYIQVFMIVVWLIGIVIIFSIITDRSLTKLFTGLGALSAVLLLVFKDTILGFVASIQVSVNDTVRLGDWITMEKYGADGDVFEINLASVKVRNFDNTITTIPTYYLISDSFKNWRGMSQSGGRRIKRAVLIKASSIQFLNPDEISEFKNIQLISDYVNKRSSEINSHNERLNADKSVLINGRNLTNFGLFRKYVDEYLKQNPAVNKDMMVMSRQLAPTPNGIPLEIYAFSQDKIWKNYEHIMADIFDHILASIPYFKLEVFEYPTGKDLHIKLKK